MLTPLLSLSQHYGVSQLDTDSAELLTRVRKQWGRWLKAANSLAASTLPLSLSKSLPLLAAFSRGSFLPPKSTEVFNRCLQKWFEPKVHFLALFWSFFLILLVRALVQPSFIRISYICIDFENILIFCYYFNAKCQTLCCCNNIWFCLGTILSTLLLKLTLLWNHRYSVLGSESSSLWSQPLVFHQTAQQ